MVKNKVAAFKIKKTGSILIISLWLLLFLSIVSLGLRKITASQIVFSRFYLNYANIDCLSQAALEEAALERRNDITSEYDSLQELRTERTIKNKSGKVSYCFIDEESKININLAPRVVLKRLPRLSDGLAIEIIDARKEKSFRVVEELLSVDGIDEDLFYGKEDDPGLIDFITVWGRGKVNVNTASEEVLEALIGEESIVERIIDFRNGLDNKPDTEDDEIFISRKNIIGKLEGVSARESLLLAETSRLMSVVSETYSVKINGQTTNKQEFTNTVVYSPRERAVKLWY